MKGEQCLFPSPHPSEPMLTPLDVLSPLLGIQQRRALSVGNTEPIEDFGQGKVMMEFNFSNNSARPVEDGRKQVRSLTPRTIRTLAIRTKPLPAFSAATCHPLFHPLPRHPPSLDILLPFICQCLETFAKSFYGDAMSFQWCVYPAPLSGLQQH